MFTRHFKSQDGKQKEFSFYVVRKNLDTVIKALITIRDGKPTIENDEAHMTAREIAKKLDELSDEDNDEDEEDEEDEDEDEDEGYDTQ